MKAYLIQFKHTVYCQGWDNITEQRLVYAASFVEARGILRQKFDDARDFVNLTIE